MAPCGGMGYRAQEVEIGAVVPLRLRVVIS